MSKGTIVWFHQNLRVRDNPALAAAIARGEGVVPLYMWSPEEEGRWRCGAASRWWLHQSLQALASELEKLGVRLVLRKGSSWAELERVITECDAGAVYWNRRFEPALARRDEAVQSRLLRAGVEVRIFNGTLLHEPEEIKNSAGKPFRIFTAFWRRCVEKLPDQIPSAQPLPSRIKAPASWPSSVPLDEFELEPKVPWTTGLEKAWRPGEAGARAAMENFFSRGLAHYAEARNHPAVPGTSRLSPHLHFGEVSIWEVVRQLRRYEGNGAAAVNWRASKFLAELGWREFAYYLLVHFPESTDEPLRSEFKELGWSDDEMSLRRWQRGMTGFPIVDAGMRELWATGWMHNRVRMIVASFLVKDLLLPWQEGARWFWDTLVDADLANNTLGWQWTAGCGVDASPFFRIFNPMLQGRKFDPEGEYVRKWCPELSRLPARWIHEPAAAPKEVLREAEVIIGQNYPEPMVNHAHAREAALAAFNRGGRK